MAKKNKNRVTVIIPTYNSWTTLKECISSVQKQTLKPDEIIVVDNNSSDGTSKRVNQKFPSVKLVTLSINTGVTGGRNAGINKATESSDYLFFFDHDMVAEPNMLKELLLVAETDSTIGIVTPKIYYWGNKKRIWSAGTGINLWTGQILFRGGEDVGQYEDIEEVQVAPAALLVKRKVIRKVKAFDNCYFATYEDTDFCFRVRKRGFKTFYAPKAVAYHKLSDNPIDDAERVLSRASWVGRNRVIFMKRFGKSFPVFILFLPVFLSYYFYLAIKISKFNKWLDFIKGTIVGLLPSFISERNIPFSYIGVIRKAIGDDVETILDLGCGEGRLMEVLAVDEAWKVTGVDLYLPSINIANTTAKYTNLIKGDIEKVVKNLISERKKFDVVLCSQVIEHLSKEKGERLLGLLDKLATKRIVISTPRGYFEQIEESLGVNKHQEHLSQWWERDFGSRGYIVSGTGLRFLWSYSGLARSNFKLIASFFRLIAFILSPIVYYFPILSVNLIAIKNIQSDK